ncbi:hypothetical protein, conserved [Leishmania donovani]|nr:hypothetical protein, conserved [Leishmania donovani]
MRICRDR